MTIGGRGGNGSVGAAVMAVMAVAIFSLTFSVSYVTIYIWKVIKNDKRRNKKET